MLFHQKVDVWHEPRAFAHFVDELVQEATSHEGPERRGEPRHRIVLPVSVSPADRDGAPTGEAFRALTRDISNGGVCLLSPRPVDADLLVVQFVTRSGNFSTLVEVTRNRSLGPLFEIAGRFVTEGPGRET